MVLNAKNAIVGKRVEIAPVINFNNVIIGRSTLDGTVVNAQNARDRLYSSDDSVGSHTGLPTGILFRYLCCFRQHNNKLTGI